MKRDIEPLQMSIEGIYSILTYYVVTIQALRIAFRTSWSDSWFMISFLPTTSVSSCNSRKLQAAISLQLCCKITAASADARAGKAATGGCYRLGTRSAISAGATL